MPNINIYNAVDFKWRSQDVISKAIETVTENFIKNLVDCTDILSSSRNHYLSGIVIEKTKLTASVSLEGFLANAIENGLPGFDMKPGFQNSSKVKFTKKGGWYLTIPLGKQQSPIRNADPSVARYLSGFSSNNQSVKLVRVSNKSNKSSWMYPGIQARQFFKIQSDQILIDKIISDSIAQSIKR